MVLKVQKACAFLGILIFIDVPIIYKSCSVIGEPYINLLVSWESLQIAPEILTFNSNG